MDIELQEVIGYPDYNLLLVLLPPHAFIFIYMKIGIPHFWPKYETSRETIARI